ncbi:MAG: Hemolysin-type calcium-binding region [Rhodospirillales bacterium]|nr:Hemolysin-type calcium-binding region [Rhodospirillales bacterium]
MRMMTLSLWKHRALAVLLSCAGVVPFPLFQSSAAAAVLKAAEQTPAVVATRSVDVSVSSLAAIPAGQTIHLLSLSTSGTHGKVVEQDATTVTYTPGSYYASLKANATATDSFGYCLKDSTGSVSCNSVTVTIVGAAGTATASTGAGYTCLRNWYVAQNGSDRSGGTSSSTPWQTLQHANDSGLLRPGDCVNVANGTYPVRNTIYLNRGGSANSPNGYVVYRSASRHGAKIKAVAAGMQDVVAAQANYLILDGFEVDGGNLGLTNTPFTYGSGIAGYGHHFQVLNNVVHDCGGEGIGATYKDWYWIIGNTTYNNAHFNGGHMSGISIYEPRAVSFTPTSADASATYHIIIKDNVSHDNEEAHVAGAHTDGNGIILDDFRNTQSGAAAYPYRSLVQGNTTYANGARGVHLFHTDHVTVEGNVAYGNNLDLAIAGTWRGELSNAFSSNNSWTNNQAAATSIPTNERRYNTAVLDGHSGAANVNVIWSGNANFDTRTHGKSYQIDDPSRAATFPADNPLGRAL